MLDVESLPSEYKEIYKNFIMPVDTNISLDKVILSSENRQKFDLFLREMDNKVLFARYGLVPMNRILMYGDSGTGKTYSTKALCNTLGYTMIYIDIARALSTDTVSENISSIFSLANYIGECIIMLDECDAIAWQRDTGNDSGRVRRATNSIFQQLDQMRVDNVFVAATNMLHRLDAAFLRRFNLKMEFKRPQFDIMEAIKQFLLPGFEFIDDVDKTTLEIVDKNATRNTKLSYYEIQCLVERAMKDALIEGVNTVRSSDIYRDLACNMNLKLRFNVD